MRYLLLLVVVMPKLLLAQGLDKWQQKLDSIALQDVPPRAPGIATAIVQNGQLVYEKYAGYADFMDSSLINSNTRFNIASNGKQFTALAVLNLVETKQINLSDDIRKWFPRLYPAIREKITVQSLLTHTSGIRDCYDLLSLQGYTWWERSLSNADILALLEQQEELNFTPHSTYLYSNSNYILLALLVEKVSGKSFLDYTNALFRKMAMYHTSFEPDYRAIRGPIAKAYFNFDTWTTYDWRWNVVGDGNLFTTLPDQVQWEKIVQTHRSRQLNRRIIELSQLPVAGDSIKLYGYGLEFGRYKGIDYVFHEGATGAWKATLIRFPSRRTSLLTFTNTGKSIPAQQTRQMADLLLGNAAMAEQPVTRPSTVGAYIGEEDIVGTYLTTTDFAFQFEVRNQQLFLKRMGRNDVELEREAANIFHQKYDSAFKQAFTRNEQGQLQVTAYYTTHAPYTLVKTTPLTAPIDAKDYEGVYYNRETNTTLHIRQLEALNYELVRNNKKSTAILVTSTKMLAGAYRLEFLNGELLLSGDRIKRIRYIRQH
ncbi:serine hydrolase domain-containing protein [Flavihumibacter sp. CACIAM 22H1]|uniref:serine hydrolase domain-containing protein n=1 Tax=Flavihumibacter sp. CACIAM 22H1 TaxID=1812911 RepID=UPI0007A88883|nr:serine hydrolase domain-containing protein [Flavihumibacter sp. CACIAM 22H1]KYP14768.1 MAG: hypothetical protein A1D16_05665 [Flavihumibacter sp. CACIAM 22H1]